MKVLALVSGGKDSCYNALLCQEHGHAIIALGNLYPMDPDVEELDSYMYQTVGHGLITAYAECTGLPMFRKRITGTSAEQGLIYQEECMENDEVEDLASLLLYAKQQMPEIEAVSSGAIASDYQRSRVERICARLGLVSLAYMWHQPQSLLLQKMIDCGIDARLIKVAAAGLDPEKHLGKSISEMSRYLHKLREQYGINVCGEGGEYETLTLDCPLFTCGKIVIDEREIVVVSKDSLAPVGWCKPTAFHVEKKEGCPTGTTEPRVIEVPDVVTSSRKHLDATIGPSSNQSCRSHWNIVVEETFHSRFATFNAHCIALDGVDGKCLGVEKICKAFTEVLDALQEHISENGMSLRDSVFCLLYVPSMAHFGELNRVYSRYFPEINPASRATLEISGNSDVFIAIQILCRRGDGNSAQVLHVQSISDWAPSCIGPYSQATSYDGIVRFAGQIALDPATLSINEASFEGQVARVSKTCDLLGPAMKIDFKQSMLWSILYVSDESLKFDGMKTSALSLLDQYAHGSDSESDAGSFCEEYLASFPPKLQALTLPRREMMMIIQCPCLPRNVLIELQSTNVDVDVACFVPQSDSEDEGCHTPDPRGWLVGLRLDSMNPPEDHFRSHILYSIGGIMKLNMIYDRRDTISTEQIAAKATMTVTQALHVSQLTAKDLVQVTAYINTTLCDYFDDLYGALHDGFREIGFPGLFVVPISGVWSGDAFDKDSSLLGLEIFAKR